MGQGTHYTLLISWAIFSVPNLYLLEKSVHTCHLLEKLDNLSLLSWRWQKTKLASLRIKQSWQKEEENPSLNWET